MKTLSTENLWFHAKLRIIIYIGELSPNKAHNKSCPALVKKSIIYHTEMAVENYSGLQRRYFRLDGIIQTFESLIDFCGNVGIC